MTPEQAEIKELQNRVVGLEAELSSYKSGKTIKANADLSDAVLAHLIDSIGDFVIITNEGGAIQYVNKAVISRFGYDEQEIIGKASKIFIQPSERDYVSKEISIRTMSMHSWEGEVNNVTKDGEIFRVNLKTSAYTNPDGENYYIAISHEITRIVNAERELLHERELLQNLMDSMPDTIYFKDTEGKFIRINKAQAQILGVESPDDAIGKSDFDFFDEVHSAEAYKDEQKIIACGTPLIGKPEYIRTSDGTYKWVSASKAPYLNQEGEITGIMGISRDINAEQEAHKLLAENEALLSGVINGMTDLLIIRDKNHKTIKFNKAVEDYFGGLSLNEIENELNENKKPGIFNTCSIKAKPEKCDNAAVEIFDRTTNKHFECRTTLIPMSDDGNNIIVEQIRDITEKKDAETDLRLLYNKFSQISSQLPGMVYQFILHPDKTYGIPYSNDKIERIFGVSLKEVQEQPHKLYSNIHHHDVQQLAESVEVSAQTLQQWNHEFRIIRDKSQIVWLKGTSIPEKLDDGSVLWHGFITDITKEKQIEADFMNTHHILESTLNAIPDLLFELDASGLIYSCHAPKDNLQLALNSDDLVGRNITDAMPEHVCVQIFKAINEAEESGYSTGVQYHISNEISTVWLELSISKKTDTTENHRYIALARDITSRKEIDIQLARQSRVLEGVAKATTALLIGGDLNEAIQYAFETVGTAMQVDRIYLFEYHHGGKNYSELLLSQRFEWCSRGTDPQIDNPELQNLPADFMPRWYEQLSVGLPVEGLVKDFPENERKILEPQNIISLLVVPVFVGQTLFGFVGLDDCTHGSIWSQSESLILQSLASGLGNAILRKRSDEQVRFSENRFRVMYEESPLGFVLIDQSGEILDTNRAFLSLLSYQLTSELPASIFEMIPEKYDALKEVVVDEIKKTGRSGPIELHLVTPQGKDIPILLNLVLVRDLDQKPRVWGVIEDISERKKSESEIIKARDEANKANKAKSEFLANMSHEIRTPLNAILGFSELLADQIEDDKQREFVNVINTSGKNLLLIINDILDLSKIEAGRIKIELEPVNPRNVLNELKHIFSLPIREKKLQFISDIDPALPESLMLDETRIRQILFNLVGNAVKFTQKGGITLSVKVLQKVPDNSIIDLMFEVSDTGIGIPADQHELIFQAFRQTEGQSTRKFGGTGLGLTITKRFIEMMNGRITLESKPGAGSTFKVWLFDVKVSSLNKIKSLTEDIELARSIVFEDQLILLVEDIELNRMVIREMLRDKNVRLIEAVNGEHGLEMVRLHHPDLILMDMQMPVMDGYSVTRMLKADPEFNHIPIVALTASAMKNEAYEIRNLCDGYLQKPVLPDMLMTELSKFLKNKSRKGSDNHSAAVMDITNESNITASEMPFLEPEKVNIIFDELKQIQEGMIIDEIIGFAVRLGFIADEHNSEQLLTLSNQIKSQADSFQIEKLQSSFYNLSNLLKKLTKL
ncbi:MAG: PAS domain S-box protein [Lentimicrobium sp.]|jgi:PAS domain S-box-containing protein|nr:PAS domain S-box protein [Lentimicrobium sp.]